ncbi:MAG: metal-binding protein [Salinarimonadaceae bacterium]|nr:MAG: metal-binding protein [Salinarimonadaceae bacterium]
MIADEPRRLWTLLDGAGRPFSSPRPGLFGGNARARIYGRLDCPSALAALTRGGPYARHRVFFADEATAMAAGYRPCGNCMRDAHHLWKASRGA